MRIFELLNKNKFPKKVSTEPTSGLWFQHHSPEWVKTLKPMSYKELEILRPDYPIDERKDEEELYHQLTGQSIDTSFLYATVVGHHRMGTPEEYPGFTYYFTLTPLDVEQVVFDVIDVKQWMEPTKGAAGLQQALDIWKEHGDGMKSFYAKDIGEIDPRIEVVIPFSVDPQLYFPQQEDR